MKKSSALALAIAGTMAAPMVMADGGGGLYMSARLGVQQISNDDETEEKLEAGDIASRLGWRGETDLGNGKTVYAKLEAAMQGFGMRSLNVGIRGDFGDLNIAESAYASYYNHVVGPVDPNFYAGGTGIIGGGRTAEHVEYSGGTGAVSFGVTVEMDGTDSTEASGTTTGISGTQVGVSIGLGDWTLGLGTRDSEDSAANPTNGAITGVTISGALGDIGLAASAQSDDDIDGMIVHAAFGSFWVEYGQYDGDAGTPNKVSAGYAASIGRNTSWWAEAESYDGDDVDADGTKVAVALKYDWN